MRGLKRVVLMLIEVEVAMMAKVAELKQAVEDVFSHSPRDKHVKISWYIIFVVIC